MIGQTLGHYRIVEKLGAGGMGVVYKAEDTRLQRPVALKFLSGEFTTDKQASERYLREARAASALSHPNICTIHSVEEHDGQAFIVMELVEGESLQQILQAGPVKPADVERIGMQVAEALDAAHAKGIVHRDIKPGNIIVDPRGQVKVLDFGLARRVSTGGHAELTTAATLTGSVAGTPFYMAPEQLTGEPPDTRTDLYALGVVLYEMATGRRPFRDEITAKLFNAILNQAPPPPRATNAAIPAELERIILKCLEKDPAHRYQSAREISVDLRRLGAPSASLRPIPMAAQQTCHPWKTYVTGAAALIVIAAALLAFYLLGRSRNAAPIGGISEIHSLAVKPLDNMTGDPNQEYFVDGMTEALTTELAKIRSLKVISRTTVMRYKKTDKSLPEIARELGVEGIVEGSVSRGGGRVKITAQLIQAANDTHLWADSFDRPEADVLSLQSDVARAVAGQVRAALTPEEQQRLTPIRKVNPEAYDLVLRADHLSSNAAGPDEALRAVELAQRAVAIDPASAEAHASLAGALQTAVDRGARTGKEMLPLVRAEAERAIELDDTLADAHLARNLVLVTAYDWEAANREAIRAIELAPNNGNAHGAYGYGLILLGRAAEGEKEIRTCLDLDPLNLVERCALMNVLYAERRDAEAIAQARAILDLNPKWFYANYNMSALAFFQGRPEEALARAVASWQGAWEDFKLPPGMNWDAYTRWIPEELRRRHGKPWSISGFIAAAYAMYGQPESAFPYLARAIDDHEVWSTMLWWPELDSLRADPRFLALIKRMNLPVEVYGRPYREVAAAAR